MATFRILAHIRANSHRALCAQKSTAFCAKKRRLLRGEPDAVFFDSEILKIIFGQRSAIFADSCWVQEHPSRKTGPKKGEHGESVPFARVSAEAPLRNSLAKISLPFRQNVGIISSCTVLPQMCQSQQLGGCLVSPQMLSRIRANYHRILCAQKPTKS